jgi:ElaB/YqjD/DUF883 family membrane-anchored ribosome-binding protein
MRAGARTRANPDSFLGLTHGNAKTIVFIVSSCEIAVSQRMRARRTSLTPGCLRASAKPFFSIARNHENPATNSAETRCLGTQLQNLTEESAMSLIAPWRKRSNGSIHLERKLSALQDDLERLQRDLAGLASAGGEIAGERMSDALESASDSARAAAGRAVEQLETWTNGNLDPMRNRVRSQPLGSVLLSVGAGALVGALLMAPGSTRNDKRR